MRKCLLFAALLTVSQLDVVSAQTTSLFNAPDTVCAKQLVHLSSNVLGATSHYWGFCSGYMFNTPTALNIGGTYQMNVPSDIDIQQDGGNFYGFVLNNGTNEFLRFNYGSSLNNIPSVTNFGNLTNVLPTSPTSLYPVHDTTTGNWHVFVAGGVDQTNSTLARLDFGKSLSNTPNIANFGNFNNALNSPRGLFVQQDTDGHWYGYAVNSNQLSNSLVFFDFRGTNVSITPEMTDLGNLGNIMAQPSDLSAVKDAGSWYFFVTNFFNNTVTRIDIGTYLKNLTPTGVNLGNLNNTLFSPSSITTIKDCGSMSSFITNLATSELIRMDMPNANGPYTGVNYANALDSAHLNSPAALSHILRYRDDLFAFAVNLTDTTISRFVFAQCTNTSISSSTAFGPPSYSYDTAGLYNVYYAINEGLPTMQVECKQIRVLPIPAMTVTPDTVICQGDTVRLVNISISADSIRWSPDYNIDDPSIQLVKAWPEYTVKYHVTLNYPSGCIVDTNILVTVSKVKADAGPDRTLADGATTLLGGPMTSENGNYIYSWTPTAYLTSSSVTNPSATPPTDFTYYLSVTELNDDLGCRDIDTVVIRAVCAEVSLPNAFNPSSLNGAMHSFGILNKQLVKLNYFRIYDRWGAKVFETTDPTKAWDGTFAGKDAAQGVYVWVADGFCATGRPVHSEGNVTLIR